MKLVTLIKPLALSAVERAAERVCINCHCEEQSDVAIYNLFPPLVDSPAPTPPHGSSCFNTQFPHFPLYSSPLLCNNTPYEAFTNESVAAQKR